MSLREMRRLSGFSQERLAFLLDVSAYTISRWEQGKVKPTSTNVRRLALALRVTTDQVLDAIHRPPPADEPALTEALA